MEKGGGFGKVRKWLMGKGLERQDRNPETGTRKETAKPHVVMVSRDPTSPRWGFVGQARLVRHSPQGDGGRGAGDGIAE